MENKFKSCIICSVYQSIDLFYKNLNKDKHFNICKKCHYNRYTEWRKNPDNLKKVIQYRRNAAFKRRYGITLEQYEQMVKDQNNQCLICERQPDGYGAPQSRVLSVDHCHTSGKIRGLLCHRCNTALGALREDTDIIKKALAYIEKHF